MYETAEADVLAGKNVMIGSRMMQSENLGEIRNGRQEWERRLITFTRGRSGPRLVNFT
ncbi:hypothetical protein [Psychromonas sp. psych-6C06]|uniref:hypothetical protein n=1 Tax=Psychromonas sp. psych-6C06 TaxID=2058089 RepID=UPI001EE6F734|nr:hypothetical protein [Psychromonas sp. psych-6C06]